MVDASTTTQIIALKVMRLARPKFAPVLSLIDDPYDEMSVSIGEIDLQTNTQKIALGCKLDVNELKPGESRGQVVSHEVKELGQHILVCIVTYKSTTSASQVFRKFFKFPVARPIDVRTKFYNAEITNIGKLDMEWRTSMGERGRLQTSALQRIVPGCGDTRVYVERIPATVRARQSFEMTCRIHNCCDRSLDLILSFDRSRATAFVFCSTSGMPLGQVPPNGYADFVLELMPIIAGYQSISGIILKDAFNKRLYEFDDVAQVFVT